VGTLLLQEDPGLVYQGRSRGPGFGFVLSAGADEATVTHVPGPSPSTRVGFMIVAD
jgi:hypothetical protein